ncbi:ALP1-like protein [Tanacetum coccineum]
MARTPITSRRRKVLYIVEILNSPGCLGALDGTSIRVTPPSDQKPRYRTRKADIETNVLGVCCPNMQFIYVLPGWEGSAHDGRVLRDGLKIPQGCYYLVDAGYCNASGFLAPFRGRWNILASPSFFPIVTQVRIILACCLLHNLIRKHMRVDPQELEQNEEDEIDEEQLLIKTMGSKAFGYLLKVYWAFVYLIPKSTVKDINTVLKGFFWNYGDNRITLEETKSGLEVNLRAKDQRGLGLKPLHLWNKALFSKNL